MMLVRILLIPFSILYGMVILTRSLLYKTGLLNRTEFDIPVICVGNLSFGGTGKTPHIEYLIRLLETNNEVAVLSRGYRRKTSGYLLVNETAVAYDVGDEPLQIKKKFKNVAVGVCENRVLGVPNLLADSPETNVILMDDGFQHLEIKAGLNIILTDYSHLFTRDFIAPSGTLREFRSGAKRADIIIVTKCPEHISTDEQHKLIQEIAPLKNQKVFFTYQTFSEPAGLYINDLAADANADVLLFAGIAYTNSLEKHLSGIFKSVTTIKYSDHKDYSKETIGEILTRYNSIVSDNKIIMTTEKDAVKLQSKEFEELFRDVKIFYQPMEIEFTDSCKTDFNKLILDYVIDTN